MGLNFFSSNSSSSSSSSASVSSSSSSNSSSSSGPSPTSTALTLKELRRIRVLDMANGGIIQEIPSPIPASQFLLRLHHKSPEFLLCDSASIRVGKRPCPLRSSTLLAPGNLYLLLPLAAFHKRILPSSCSFAASLLLLLDKHMPRTPQKAAAAAAQEERWWWRRRRIMKSNRIAPSLPTMVFTTDSTTSTTYSKIVCDSDPEAVSRYIEHLISRSNSWRPDLDAVVEEILSHSSGGRRDLDDAGDVHLILHMDADDEEDVVRVRDDQILPPAPAPAPTLTKSSSRWPAERRDRVMSSIIWI